MFVLYIKPFLMCVLLKGDFYIDSFVSCPLWVFFHMALNLFGVKRFHMFNKIGSYRV